MTLLLPAGVIPAEEGDLAGLAECHDQATVIQEVRLNAGVMTEQVQVQQPLSIEIPVSVDTGVLVDCMERMGLNPDVAKAAYFDRQRDCRAKARRAAVRIADAGKARQIGGLDAATFDRCMRGEIEVEVE